MFKNVHIYLHMYVYLIKRNFNNHTSCQSSVTYNNFVAIIAWLFFKRK